MAAKTPVNLKMEEGNEKKFCDSMCWMQFLSAKKCN